MGRIGITFDEVAAIADSMLAETINPTIKSVRERLGTGSSNTIQRHLAAWRDALPKITAATIELPSGIITAFSQEIGRARSEAKAESEARLVIVQAESAELAVLGEKLEAELEELHEGITVITTDRDMLRVTLKEQSDKIDRLSKENERERYAAEQARIEVAETRIKLGMQDQNTLELSKSIEKLRSENTAAIQLKIDAEKMVAVLTAQLESAHEKSSMQANKLEDQAARIDQLKADNLAVSQTRTIAEREAAVLTARLDSEQEKSRALLLENAELVAQTKTDRQSGESARIEAANVANNLEKQSALLAEKVSANKELTQLFETEKAAHIEAEKKIAVLTTKLGEHVKAATERL